MKRCCSSGSHLGRWTGYLWTSRSPKCWYGTFAPLGGLTPQQIQWRGSALERHCSCIRCSRSQQACCGWRQSESERYVDSHPECNFEVCKLSDYVGSTDFIIKTIAASAPGTRWLVGTELNLVNRIAE